MPGKSYDNVHFANGLRTSVAVDNVHDTTPTAASLVTALGTAAVAGAGSIKLVNDAAGGINVYACISDGTDWFFLKFTKSV